MIADQGACGCTIHGSYDTHAGAYLVSRIKEIAEHYKGRIKYKLIRDGIGIIDEGYLKQSLRFLGDEPRPGDHLELHFEGPTKQRETVTSELTKFLDGTGD